jgi:hypothetical protein
MTRPGGDDPPVNDDHVRTVRFYSGEYDASKVGDVLRRGSTQGRSRVAWRLGNISGLKSGRSEMRS